MASLQRSSGSSGSKGDDLPRDTHIEYTELETKRKLSIGVSDDCKRLYVGYQTRRGDGDIMQLKKGQAGELGSTIMNWAQHHMVEDEVERA